MIIARDHFLYMARHVLQPSVFLVDYLGTPPKTLWVRVHVWSVSATVLTLLPLPLFLLYHFWLMVGLSFGI